MYEEVETKSSGRKAVAVNLCLQAGLSQTPLGNNGMRKILHSSKITPPSRKCLQKTSNKVMPLIESVNDSADMRHRCHQLVDVKTLRGSDSPHAIPVQSDDMYNKPLI